MELIVEKKSVNARKLRCIAKTETSSNSGRISYNYTLFDVKDGNGYFRVANETGDLFVVNKEYEITIREA